MDEVTAEATKSQLTILLDTYESSFECPIKCSLDEMSAVSFAQIFEQMCNQQGAFDISVTYKLGSELVTIVCHLHKDYPAEFPPKFEPVVVGSDLTTAQLNRINDELQALLTDGCDDLDPDNVLVSVFFEFGNRCSDQDNAMHVTQSAAAVPQQARTTSSSVIKRVLMWTHHIRVKHKTCVYPRGREFHISGLCVVDKPGFIFAEGLEDDVDKFTSVVKSERWKRILVKAEETDPTGHRLLPGRPRFEELKTTGNLMAKFREWGREDLVTYALQSAANSVPLRQGSSPEITGVGNRTWSRQLIVIDHMNNFKKYRQHIESWISELDLSGKLYFFRPSPRGSRVEGVFLILEAQNERAAQAFKTFGKRLRTAPVDVDAKVQCRAFLKNSPGSVFIIFVFLFCRNCIRGIYAERGRVARYVRSQIVPAVDSTPAGWSSLNTTSQTRAPFSKRLKS